MIKGGPMTQFIIKTLVSAVIIAVISIVSRRFPGLGGLIASLPLTSILAMIWLYQDTQDVQKVISLSNSIFWMVIPSLSFFIVLPYLIKRFNFYPGIGLSILLLTIVYTVYSQILSYFKINL